MRVAPRIALFAGLSLLAIVAIAFLSSVALTRFLTQAVMESEWRAVAMIANHEAEEVDLPRILAASLGPEATGTPDCSGPSAAVETRGRRSRSQSRASSFRSKDTLAVERSPTGTASVRSRSVRE